MRRNRLTVVGTLTNFSGDITTPTAYLTTANLILNSILSTKTIEICVRRRRQLIFEKSYEQI